MKLRDDGEILTFDTGCWVLVTGYWLLDVSIVAPVKFAPLVITCPGKTKENTGFTG